MTHPYDCMDHGTEQPGFVPLPHTVAHRYVCCRACSGPSSHTQDVLHRLSMPALAAGSLPRYSLVWKLVLVPTRAGQQVTLARPEWGRPTAFGSAAVLERVVRGMAAAGHKAGPGGSGGKGEQSGEQVGAEAGAAMGDGAAGAAGGQGGKEEQVEDEREGCGAREAKRVRREDGRGAGG